MTPRSNLRAAKRKTFGDLAQRIARVAAIAAADADNVDREARFPQAAITAAKGNKLLGILVPREFGGEEASIFDVTDMCYALGRACSSAAMIYAMHQVKVACVVRHGRGNAWQEAFIRRIASEQMLLASSTTEGQGGGNVRSSEAAIERNGDAISLERDATVISYGAEADGLVTAARRAGDAAASDQVLLALRQGRLRADAHHELGHAGHARHLQRRLHAARRAALPTRSCRSPTSASMPRPWCRTRICAGRRRGPASPSAAVERRASVHAQGRPRRQRPDCRRAPRISPRRRPSQQAAGADHDHGRDVRRHANSTTRALGALDFQSAINLLKVDASELAGEIVMSALRATGLSGYRNDGDLERRPPPARRPLGAADDQQRPHPRQYRDRYPDGRRLAAAAELNPAHVPEQWVPVFREGHAQNKSWSLIMNIVVRSPAADANNPADPLDHLSGALFHKMGADGVYARTALYEGVVEKLAALITRHREAGTEVMRFPPVMSRAQLEKSGYLKSFPNLLGCVCCLHGSEREIREAVARFDEGGDWTTSLSPADLVLSPAACYPVYPIAAAAARCRKADCASTSPPTASAASRQNI